MATLYEIDHELQQVEDLIAAGDDEAAAEILVQYRDELEADRSAKVDRTCGFIRELEARATARKAEADRFIALAKTDANLADRLKAMLLDHLRVHGLKKLETERFRLTRAANGGKQGIELDVPPEDLPEEFVREVLHADLEAIREALEDGAPLTFARLVERGEHLRVR